MQKPADLIGKAKLDGSSLPIRRLVAEGFTEIFVYCVDGHNLGTSLYHFRIRNTALTSTAWPALVFEIQVLWSYIHDRQSHDDLLKSLMRSKDCPLVAQYGDYRLVDEEEEVVFFVEMAYREIHGWRLANLTIMDLRLGSAELLPSDLNMSLAPLLEELLLDCSSRPPLNYAFNPFGLGGERLRAVS
ncbi:hypothetical protein FRB96_009128 [Tulasnella sp. 330]|nr:hypothetical protein FRB96_009128 [Tulasnella sp. 330]